MQSVQFYELVKSMRKAQKDYYDCPSHYHEKKQQFLKIAKHFEKRVDVIIAATEADIQHATLFSQQ